MTGLNFSTEDNYCKLEMTSDNPESKNWSNLEWFKYLKGWMDTMIKLCEIGIFKKGE